MNIKNFIAIKEFCESYSVPETFITSLHDNELIEIVTIQEIPCLNLEQIKDIEKLITFHYELNINMEGIHAISHLLNTVVNLQSEVIELKNRLTFYES